MSKGDLGQLAAGIIAEEQADDVPPASDLAKEALDVIPGLAEDGGTGEGPSLKEILRRWVARRWELFACSTSSTSSTARLDAHSLPRSAGRSTSPTPRRAR